MMLSISTAQYLIHALHKGLQAQRSERHETISTLILDAVDSLTGLVDYGYVFAQE